MVSAFIGLGSNLDGPRPRVIRAFRRLGRLPGCRLAAASSLYRSAPLAAPGVPFQDDYVNAVALLETGLDPLILLELLHGVEAEQGRRRAGVRWGPRTLDLDLLLYGAVRIERRDLALPHPELHRRAFVLYPLAEIDPEAWVPGRGSVKALLASVADTGLTRIAPAPDLGSARGSAAADEGW